MEVMQYSHYFVHSQFFNQIWVYLKKNPLHQEKNYLFKNYERQLGTETN